MAEDSKKIRDFLDLVSNVMEAYTAALFTVENEQEKSLKLFSSRSFSKSIDPECRLHRGEGFINWVYREQKPLLVKHFDRSTTTLKFYTEDEEIKSLLAVPLPEREGVLYVDSKKSYRFTEEREKICRQMATTSLALIQSDREGKEKRITDNMLALSRDVDELLGGVQTREGLHRLILEIFCRRLNLMYAFFVVPEQLVHSCQPGAKPGRYLHHNSPPGSFSKEGLLGWSIKNKKKIVREKIGPNIKSYVLNKVESLGDFANFVGVPVFHSGERVHGGFGLIKPPTTPWHPLEVDTIAHLAQRFFREWRKLDT